jgi:Zn-dependent membrane protease YugP
MFLDWSYVILVLPAVILAMWAQARVSSTFNRYSKYVSERGMTGYDSAKAVLKENGLHHITVEQIDGNLTDHFDPRTNVIRLSRAVYNERSIAAIGVAAHEAGHAVQHNEGYTPIKIRNSVLPVANIGSYAAFPLAIIGIIFSMEPLINIGIILFSAVVLFQLVTLPVEFDASNRAIKTLDSLAILNKQEIRGTKRVLNAAAMTYVAATAVALMNLIRLLVLANRSRD